MTMHPDTRIPHAERLAVHIDNATPKPRRMEDIWPAFPPFHDATEEARETRGAMVVAALAGWSIICLIVAAILVVF